MLFDQGVIMHQEIDLVGRQYLFQLQSIYARSISQFDVEIDVVVIDENNPGNIRRTNEAYDRKVAGVVSGANGVNPGLSLSQKDVLEGDYPLTMLGRVYVKVTGKVNVGDMLTTSTKHGYAMAVEDHSKANGSVIGKAMTAHGKGDGLVLILVNLQ